MCIRDSTVFRQMSKVLLFRSGGKFFHNSGNVFFRQLIAVGYFDTFLRSVNKQNPVVGLVLLQHHNAGGNGRAEEQVARKLNHAVDEVVVNQILANLLFRATSVHDTRKAYYGSRSVGSQP